LLALSYYWDVSLHSSNREHFDLQKKNLHLQADARHGEILGQLLYAAKIVAEKEGIADGFRVVINSGASACMFFF